MADISTQKVNKRLEMVEKDLFTLKKIFLSYLKPKSPKIAFANDEQVWREIKDDYETVQEEFLQKFYPGLYGQAEK